MPTELVRRINLDLIYPRFLEAALQMLANCQARGYSYYALGTGGFRSFTDQAKLYFQGRTAPGPKVTGARPGYSLHNWGLALDFSLDIDNLKPGLQPSWKASDFDVLKEEGERLGLQVGLVNAKGKRWDEGHVQVRLKEWLGESSETRALERLLQIRKTEGEKAVWAYLDGLNAWDVPA